MKKISSISILIMSLFLFSCGETQQQQQRTEDGKPVETMNSGTIELISDIELKQVMDTVYKMYDESYPEVEFSVEYVNARKAMAVLLAGNTRIAVIGRDYLQDEDSTMKAYDVTRETMEVAKDGLVFFVNPDHVLDTLNVSQIENILTDPSKRLKDYFPSIEEEPMIAVADQNSSVYAHLMKQAANGKQIKRNLKLFETTQQVKEFIKENPNAIGIGYLSHIVGNPDFRPIRLGFFHKDGKREMPQAVHQSYIVMERYPYIVTHYAYLLEDRRNLPWWTGTFLSKETKVQEYFNKYGIVPAYAKIILRKRD